VQKALSVAPAQVPVETLPSVYTAFVQSACNVSANTLRKLIDEKSVYEFCDKVVEDVHNHKTLIMALIGELG
jgi:hypothetical protein